MRIRRLELTFFACLCVAWTSGYAAEQEQVLVGPIEKMAADVIAVYREPDRRAYLDNLFRLQLAAGAGSRGGRQGFRRKRVRAGVSRCIRATRR